MKKILLLSIIFCSISCNDLLDFTIVENPNLSETSVVGQPNSAAIWLTGIERQLALFLNEIVINAEVASDNYNNDQTFYNQFLDGLNIDPRDSDIEDIEFDLNRMREMAKFGLEQVGPGDPNYQPETEAEFIYMEGLSHLFTGMYFTGLPASPGAAPQSAAEHYQVATTKLDAAIAINAKPEYYLAKARINYYTGNKAEAVSAAAQAIALSPDFLRAARFDQTEGPSNTMESGLYERGSFDDLQPLPTLDFLDPKYSFNSAAEDDPVYYLKAEEAYLIQIEAAIADNDLDGAKMMMTTLLELVNSRGKRPIDDSIEGRTHFAEGTRPNLNCVMVNGRTGLVLTRSEGNVDVANISGTSLTAEDIAGLENAEDALYLLYRTRQEIFIAEGIRMVDMGVKLVISLVEELQNSNVSTGGVGTIPQIPDFIDGVRMQLDEITYTPGACEASTTIDLNTILVANRASDSVLPFH